MNGTRVLWRAIPGSGARFIGSHPATAIRCRPSIGVPLIDPRILEAFQTMWGPFPEPVMLIHKDRTVLDINDFAKGAGITPGTKCHALSPEANNGGQCKRCQANRALQTGETVQCVEEICGKTVRGYWMPLKEVPDVYVHFGIGTAEAMGGRQDAAQAASC